jgi:hypothetical protein
VDIRDVLIDGIDQLAEWTDNALEGLTADQVNWLPDGKTVSIGFNAWHVMRTSDNIVNFVFQKQQPIWLRENYLERFGLPKVEQGTGMALDTARDLHVNDPGLLREYGRKVHGEVVGFVRNVSEAELAEVQMVKPLGEMPKWRIVRQVLMTHGFMHLGEINVLRGMMGLQFFI